MAKIAALAVPLVAIVPAAADDSQPIDEPLSSAEIAELTHFVTDQEQELLWDLPEDLDGWTDLEVSGEGEAQFQLDGTRCLMTVTQPFGDNAPANAEELLDGYLAMVAEAIGADDPPTVGPIYGIVLPVRDTDLSVYLHGASMEADGLLTGRAYGLMSGRFALTAFGACAIDDADHLDAEVAEFIESLGVIARPTE